MGNSYIEHQRQLEIDDNLLILNRSIDGTVYGATKCGFSIL